MKFHTVVGLDVYITPIDFGVSRSKVKVKVIVIFIYKIVAVGGIHVLQTLLVWYYVKPLKAKAII